MERNVENFLGCDADYWNADAVIFGAPFDSTTSFRPGARFGPSAMRHESFGIETWSPYQELELTEDCAVFDSGDLGLSFGNASLALADIEVRADEILESGKLPILLGGEHLVTLGAVRAAAQRYPGLHVIHFDAHADLREDYLGVRLSHASVMRRCWELLGDNRIHQFGIRSGDRSEFQFAEAHTELHKFDFDGLRETVENLRLKDAPVYLSIDLDCLDPSVFPGTGTPEAGGVTFLELLRAILIVSKANVVGADLVELAPMLDQSGVSTAAACKTLRELLLALVSTRTKARREREAAEARRRAEEEAARQAAEEARRAAEEAKKAAEAAEDAPKAAKKRSPGKKKDKKEESESA